MAKKVCTIMGIVFILIGLVGFVAPGFLGAHLSPTHNWIHIISGALALYFGTRADLKSAVAFCIGFGAFYGLLGLAGFMFGSPGTASAGHVSHSERLLRIVPGSFELGVPDHIIHVLIATIFLVGGLAHRPLTRPTAHA